MFVFLILPSVLAIDLSIQKQTSDEVMIVDLNLPAVVNLIVTNNGYADKFLFYTFFGIGLEPSERIEIANGATKNIELKFYPRPDYNTRGYATFYYYIQGTDKTEIEKQITVKVIDLKDSFEIGLSDVYPESSSIDIYLYNKINYEFDNLSFQATSPFFNLNNDGVLLGPYQKKVFTVQLNKEDFAKLMAGYYTADAKITYLGHVASITGQIKFAEKDIVKTDTSDSGFIIVTKTIKKSNQGNTIADSITIIKKNILSRLFTTFNVAPTTVERQGGNVYYTWKQTLNPGETKVVKAVTNWLIPLIVIVFIILIIVLVNLYRRRDVVLKKSVQFVKAKGGEFALRVDIKVQARKFVEKISIVERLPPLVRIFERFLGEQPLRYDDAKKKIEWMFNTLQPGEKRILSYIIYSRLGVLGKFALPRTVAFYEKDGKIKESTSNKAYFVAEQIKKTE